MNITRFASIFFAVAALAAAFFGVRWQMGEMFAVETSPVDPNAAEIGSIAESWAPSSAFPVWFNASAREFLEPDNAVSRFEEVVRRSPSDYRFWLELGRVYEHSEKYEQSERAFKKAIELAPSYGYPRWIYGNFLLRQDRKSEAFEQFKVCVRNHETYRTQAYVTVWDFWDKDKSALDSMAASEEARVALAQFYASKGQVEDSIRIWNSLTEASRTNFAATSKVIAQAFFERKFYRGALYFISDSGIDRNAKLDEILNPGFEAVIGETEKNFFGWKFSKTEKIEFRSETTVRKSGSRSLRVRYSGLSQPQMAVMDQTVAVTPGAKYKLTFAAKTSDLKSGGAPQMDILNPQDGRLIASSKTLPTGSNDWQIFETDFTVPENTDGVRINLSRSFCGDVCPIVGEIWLDDFALTKR